MSSDTTLPSSAATGCVDFRSPAERPWVESLNLDAYLSFVGADAVTNRFCRELAESGVAILDLGEDGRRLIDAAIAETELYFDDPDVMRVQDVWLRSKAVQALASFPLLIDTLSVAYGRRAFAFQTLSFQRGTEQKLHSDAIHFHSEPERFMCGVWIALEDISPAAGPLEYLARSHKLPVMTMQDAGVDHDTPGAEDYSRAYIPALHERLATANLPRLSALPRKGEAVVWAANLVHGGSAITDPDSTRRSLVVHIYFENCLYYTPMTSNPARRRYQARLPMNVRSGGWVWPRRAGRMVPVPRGAFVDALLRRFLRRPNLQFRNSSAPSAQPPTQAIAT